MGKLLARVLRDKQVAQTTLCRALDISDTGVTAYCTRPSLQIGILWKAGLALKYNFFAELATQFPYPPEADNPLQKRIDDLERELAIYKSIVFNKQQP